MAFIIKYRELFTLCVLLSISTTLMVIKPPFKTNYLEKYVLSIIEPVQRLFTEVLAFCERLFSGFRELRSIKLENMRLKRELQDLRIERMYWGDLLAENKRLKKLLDYKQRIDYKTIACRIIGFSPSNWFNTVTIDKGTRAGIEKDDPVISYQDGHEGLVGKVIDAAQNTATVLLLLSEESYVGAKLRRTEFKGVVVGKDFRTCQMKYLDSSADVKKGDIVITSGEGGIFPGNIPIGKVTNVEKKNYQLFCDIEVSPFVEFGKLEEVLVIKRKSSNDR
ncbi:MAG: rod shape-determining protein MreC [bacterium]|nr:rod shape-determining protein MreC [bacterium]